MATPKHPKLAAVPEKEHEVVLLFRRVKSLSDEDRAELLDALLAEWCSECGTALEKEEFEGEEISLCPNGCDDEDDGDDGATPPTDEEDETEETETPPPPRGGKLNAEEEPE